jgi:hypothetical protein
MRPLAFVIKSIGIARPGATNSAASGGRAVGLAQRQTLKTRTDVSRWHTQLSFDLLAAARWTRGLLVSANKHFEFFDTGRTNIFVDWHLKQAPKVNFSILTPVVAF